jgi:hypothetical protein
MIGGVTSSPGDCCPRSVAAAVSLRTNASGLPVRCSPGSDDTGAIDLLQHQFTQENFASLPVSKPFIIDVGNVLHFTDLRLDRVSLLFKTFEKCVEFAGFSGIFRDVFVQFVVLREL